MKKPSKIIQFVFISSIFFFFLAAAISGRIFDGNERTQILGGFTQEMSNIAMIVFFVLSIIFYFLLDKETRDKIHSRKIDWRQVTRRLWIIVIAAIIGFSLIWFF